LEGIGEVDASPEIVKAIVEAPASHAWSRGLREMLLGENPFDVERLWEKMYKGSIYYGRRGAAIAAISGVDIALWDLIGKAEGKPVNALLRGKFRDQVPVYASLYPIGNTPEEVRKNCQRAVGKGFSAVKPDGPPLGRDGRLDDQILRAVRDGIGDQIDLMVDVAEPGWDLKQGILRARMYSNYNIYFLEAPFGPEELMNYQKLSETVDVRIAYGEQHTTRYEFAALMDAGVNVVQPDISRAGGITELRRIAQLALDRGVLLIPHCWKTGISIAANLQLLSTIPNAPYLEFCQPPNSPLRYELLKHDFSVEKGNVRVPDEPGLGIQLNEKILERYRIEV
jgi:L-alanine-DL-glutamate epimerase-like enolase superfamily enzyme